VRPLDVSRASDLGSQHTRPAALLQLLLGIAGTEDRAERQRAALAAGIRIYSRTRKCTHDLALYMAELEKGDISDDAPE
jgi:hypothetical protein